MPSPLRRFVNYADASGADRARQVLNGMRVGDKVLRITVQPQPGQQAGLGGGVFMDGTAGGGSPLPSAAALSAFPAPDWPSLVGIQGAL